MARHRPDYLSELHVCTSVAQVAERQHLRSTSRHPAPYLLFQGFSSMHTTKDVIYTLPRIYIGLTSLHTTVAPSLSLDQRRGTCSETTCVSRTCKLTVLLNSTRHVERLKGVIFCDDALYKLILTLTITYSMSKNNATVKSRSRVNQGH